MDAGHEFARVEGLGQIVVGAEFEADDAIDLVALGCQHDDRGLVLGAAQAPADGKAVLARQHEVEHDEVVELARQRLVHRFGAVDGLGCEALLREVALEELAQAQVVVDDENLVFAGCHVANPSLIAMVCEAPVTKDYKASCVIHRSLTSAA